jgi:hypothetical protein
MYCTWILPAWNSSSLKMPLMEAVMLESERLEAERSGV